MLTRYQVSPLFSFGLENLFEGFSRSPALNLREDSKSYIVSTEIPGLEKDEIDISFQEGNLIISGERTEEKNEKDTKWHLKETQYGKFQRTINIPYGVDSSKIKADLKNGVLIVTIPKSEKSKPNKIVINKPLLENHNE